MNKDRSYLDWEELIGCHYEVADNVRRGQQLCHEIEDKLRHALNRLAKLRTLAKRSDPP